MATKTEWAMLAGASLGAAALFFSRGALPKSGSVVDAPITLTAADRDGLHCALPRGVGRFRCEYVAPNEPASPPIPSADTLFPVVTTDRVVYLAGGLFDEPAVKARIEGPFPDRRFVARCKVRLLEEVRRFDLRFGEGSWGAGPDPTWAAAVVSCQIE